MLHPWRSPIGDYRGKLGVHGPHEAGSDANHWFIVNTTDFHPFLHLFYTPPRGFSHFPLYSILPQPNPLHRRREPSSFHLRASALMSSLPDYPSRLFWKAAPSRSSFSQLPSVLMVPRSLTPQVPPGHTTHERHPPSQVSRTASSSQDLHLIFDSGSGFQSLQAAQMDEEGMSRDPGGRGPRGAAPLVTHLHRIEVTTTKKTQAWVRIHKLYVFSTHFFFLLCWVPSNDNGCLHYWIWNLAIGGWYFSFFLSLLSEYALVVSRCCRV